MLLRKIEVLDQIRTEGGSTIYQTMNNTQGIALTVKSLDVETINREAVQKSFAQCFSENESGTRIKIISQSRKKYNDNSKLSRTAFVNEMGFMEYKNFLLLERTIPTFQKIRSFITKEETRNFSSDLMQLKEDAKRFKNIVISFGRGDVAIKPFSQSTKEDVESLFLPIFTDIISHVDHISIDQKEIGIVRIRENTAQKIGLESISRIRNEIDFDHDVVSTFEKMSPSSQSVFLNHLSKENETAKNLSERIRKDEVERLQDEITRARSAIYEVEVLFKVYANGTLELKERLSFVSNLIHREFGSSYIESFGSYPSFQSTMPGSNAHVTFKESSSGLINYSPLFVFESPIQQEISPMSLRLHRRGAAIQSISLISNYYESGNSLIIGHKGTGKSVLTGLLTQAALNDPNTKILKMDVGSSYKRECERLGGTRYSLTLSEPSGLNPLEVFSRTEHSLEIAEIVTDFIEVLISKNINSRIGLTEEERATLDKIVISYSESRPQNPNLDDFLQFANGKIPNQVLLERWTSGGMYQNIFKPISNAVNSRYRYFDFESVANASNEYLVRGSIAAVMAQYNSEVAISGRTGPRILFFCDETTEFLNYCAPFFISTMKNSRKFGHLMILVNQDSASFEVIGRNGKSSKALFDNSDHQFLFALPKDNEDQLNFKSRHQLSELEYDSVANLRSQKGVFSEVFYKTKLGGQTFKVQLTLDEYWLLTTEKNDNDKISHLVNLGFTQEEAMQCLAQLHAKLY
jgi:hypothetical protein